MLYLVNCLHNLRFMSRDVSESCCILQTNFGSFVVLLQVWVPGLQAPAAVPHPAALLNYRRNDSFPACMSTLPSYLTPPTPYPTQDGIKGKIPRWELLEFELKFPDSIFILLDKWFQSWKRTTNHCCLSISRK